MKTRAQIAFEFVDVTAKQDSQLSVNNKQNFVDLNDLKEDELVETKYGTFEKNQFALDGSFELMPDTLDNMGWWSNQMSDEDGNFTTPLTLEINFSEVHSSLGLTFVFSKAGDYCNNLNIKYYDTNGTLLSSKNFTPDSYRYVCENNVENYAKIVITFYGTNNPYRYLKLYKILYGAEKVFEGDNLINANILEELDLLSSELRINTLDFKTFSDNDEFNIINPSGLYKLLQKRQKLKVTEQFLKTAKETNMGTFYLTSWKNEEHKMMQFEAQDLLGVLDSYNFYGLICSKANYTFHEVIGEIIKPAGLTVADDCEIDDTIKYIEMIGYVPVGTCREALQQAVFAVNAVVDCSRSDKIKIYRVNTDENSKKIEKSNIFQDTRNIEQTERITKVAVTAHSYIEDTNVEEEKLAEYTFDLNVTGMFVLKWDEPAFGTSIDFQNSGCKYSAASFITSSTCNSMMIDFDELSKYNVSNKFVIMAIATDIYYKEYEKYPAENGHFLQYETNFNGNAIVSVRNTSTTVAVEYYTINLDNGTATSDLGFSTTFTKSDVSTIVVSVYGKKYTHSTTEYQLLANDEVEVTEDNTMTVDSAYLINSSNVISVAQHILEYYQNTFEDSFQLLLSDEQISESRSIDTDYQELVGNITQLDIDLTGGFIADAKMINKAKESSDG